MGIFNSIHIASTGLTAQRLRQDVIADNIANASTTRTIAGGPYKRSRVILQSRSDRPTFKSAFLPQALEMSKRDGVEVARIAKDTDSPGRMIYDPTHPDAIKSGAKTGYVEMPNVNIVTEMTDLIAASRSYEANIAVLNGAKNTIMQALEIGR